MRVWQTISGLLVLASLPGCAPAPPAATSWVGYEVAGAARTAEVTYNIPGGGTERRTVTVPYSSPRYQFPLGATVTVQASNQTPSGDLAVRILENGQPVPGWAAGDPAGTNRYTAKPYGVATISWGVGVR